MLSKKRCSWSDGYDELGDFKKTILHKRGEVDIKEIVFDTEKSTSREHKLWFSKVL